MRDNLNPEFIHDYKPHDDEGDGAWLGYVLIVIGSAGLLAVGWCFTTLLAAF